MSETVVAGEAFARLCALLDARGVPYAVDAHAPTYTSEESARARGAAMHAGAKALLVKADERFALLVLPADCALDGRSARAALGAKRLRFANLDEIRELTGLAPGAIPPLGSLFELPTLCDPALAEVGVIHFNAAAHDRSVSLGWKDYLAVERPTLAPLGRPPQP